MLGKYSPPTYKIVYGSTTFDIPFVYSNVDTITVYVDGVKLTEGFTVTGRKIKFDTQVSGKSLLIRREVPYTQPTSFDTIFNPYEYQININQLVKQTSEIDYRLTKVGKQNQTIDETVAKIYKNKSKRGTVTLFYNTNEITVTHGLVSTPVSIILTPMNDMQDEFFYSLDYNYWVEDITSTTFKIKTDITASYTGINFYWKTICSV